MNQFNTLLLLYKYIYIYIHISHTSQERCAQITQDTWNVHNPLDFRCIIRGHVAVTTSFGT